MKEFLELRVNKEYAHLLFSESEGRPAGSLVRVIKLSKDDPRYARIPVISQEIQSTYKKSFFYGWRILRKYDRKELEAARLLHIIIKTTFEPAGEECGTYYDESVACKHCGANRRMIGPLILKKGSIPKKDIARTIAGEVVFSERLIEAYKKRSLEGLTVERAFYEHGPSEYYSLVDTRGISLSKSTLAGISPFDLSERSGAELYKCPIGHTLGLNLLTEVYIRKGEELKSGDFFSSSQKLGVKRGLLRPESLLLCSQKFRTLVEAEGYTGFDFEVVRVDSSE